MDKQGEIEIEDRTVVNFVLSETGFRIRVSIREGKLRIEADNRLVVRPVACNCATIGEDK